MNRFVFGTVVLLIPVANVTIVFAQDKGGTGGGAAPAGGGGTTTAAPTVQYYPGGVAPTPAGQPLGGGNTGDYGKFEYGRGGGSSTMYGNESGGGDFGRGPGGDTVTLGGGIEGNLNSDTHTVRKGDTLWGICDYYFRNPYQWPRIWSYNPQIQNPHWIYPGDLINLRSGAQLPSTSTGPQTTGPSMIDRRRQVTPETIFLRDTGFIDDSDKDNWGEVSGASIDKMFLTDTDEIYMHVAEGHDPKVGQELTIFRPLRSVSGGKLVQIQGSVRVNRWDPKTRTARGEISETLDVVERGARIGPVGRRFKVVPPLRNETELKAEIIASIYPHSFYGQNQVVFINKGFQDGVKPGNRLFIMRRGDDWRRTLKSDIGSERLDHYSEKPSDTEPVPKFPASDMPEEVIGEIRVLETREHNAAALVTRSIRELERNDEAVMRKGY
jgi:hypothetical protein